MYGLQITVSKSVSVCALMCLKLHPRYRKNPSIAHVLEKRNIHFQPTEKTFRERKDIIPIQYIVPRLA